MRADEICRIMESAATSGVSELLFGSLHIRFGAPPGKVQQDPVPIAMVAEMTEAQHAKQTEDTLLRSELQMRDEQLARALIEDPLRFEEMLRNGELEDAVDASDEIEDDT